MTVTFCGRSDFHGDSAVMDWLRETVENLILRGADEFLLGGYGDFDACAATVVWELKRSIQQSAPHWSCRIWIVR